MVRRARFSLLLGLTACGADGIDADNTATLQTPEPREYATQREAPTPDYEAIIASADMLEPYEFVRDPTSRPPADAKPIGNLWVARLMQANATDGHGLSGKNDDDPVSSISVLMTGTDFDAWVAQKGWTVPTHIRWNFVAPLHAARVAPAAEPGIRIWPASEARTGLQNQAAEGGRIFLRDGCFWLDRNGDETLAWFHTETGLDMDDEGFYVLVDRTSGQTSGRLGEHLTWAAPNAIAPGGPDMAAFRKACGGVEISGVGNPVSQARMNAMYPPLRAPDAMPPPGLE